MWSHRIVLHFLPPDCPEANRIERVWLDLHANAARNHRGRPSRSPAARPCLPARSRRPAACQSCPPQGPSAAHRLSACEIHVRAFRAYSSVPNWCPWRC
nr:transposase [Myxococcus xanthus]